MGEKGHFQPRSRSFWRFDERCVRQNDLKLLASVAFPSPRPTFKGNPARTLRGFLFALVFPLGYRPTCQPESPASIGFPISSATLSGFRHKKKTIVLSGFRHWLTTRLLSGSQHRVLHQSLYYIVLSGFRQWLTTQLLSGSRHRVLHQSLSGSRYQTLLPLSV